jgi:hypothetical protein
VRLPACVLPLVMASDGRGDDCTALCATLQAHLAQPSTATATVQVARRVLQVLRVLPADLPTPAPTDGPPRCAPTPDLLRQTYIPCCDRRYAACIPRTHRAHPLVGGKGFLRLLALGGTHRPPVKPRTLSGSCDPLLRHHSTAASQRDTGQG